MSVIAAKIVEVAKSKVNSTDWAYKAVKGNFGANTNKCNKFVYDVMVEAGVTPPTVAKILIFGSRPPLAGEWADKSKSIDGWTVVSEPQPGDVAAEAHQYSDATGHVAIVVAARTTVSATANSVVQNDWGFREGQKPTFRRLLVPMPAPAPAAGATPPVGSPPK